MTKKAIVRRQSIRAMRTLITKYGYPDDQFELSTGKEYNCADGTPIYWDEPDYWAGEPDCRPAVEELRMLETLLSIDWDRVAKEDRIRERFRQLNRLGPK